MNNWLRKQEVLAALGRHTQDHAPAKNRADIARFIDAFYADASPVDIVDAPIDRLFAIAHRAWRECAIREPGEPYVQLENRDGKDVMAEGRTSIFILNDNMPFLVDSITGGLTALGHEIQLLYHPIIRVERGDEGKRRKTVGRCAGADQPSKGVSAESVVYIEINRRGPRTRARIQAMLQDILSDVYAAVSDWRSMLSRLYDAARALEVKHPAIAAAELEEAVAFLDWLREDHFTLLGYRFYACKGDLTTPEASVEPGEGLGILRDPERKIWRGASGFTHMSPEHAHFLQSQAPLLITKGNVKSTVHRRVHIDYVGVKAFDDASRVTGEHRFVGLFTSASYWRRASSIPLLRRKVDHVLQRAGFDPRGHAGKALDTILQTFPRDELFQIDDDRLFETALGILHLKERPRPKVFVRPDAFERFVSVLAYVPRDNYHGEIRAKIGDVLADAYRGQLSTYYVELSQELMARIHYIIRTRPGMVPPVDPEALDERVGDVVKGWHERFRDALMAAHGEEEGRIIYYTFEDAFPVAYREIFGGAEAVLDLTKLDGLQDSNARAYHLYRRDGDGDSTVRLKIYRERHIIALSDCLPMLENLGLRVIEETAYSLQGGKPGWIHDFLLRDASDAAVDVDAVRDHVEEALGLITADRIDDDGFNALILRSGLSADQVAVLRGYGRYLRQLGLPYSQQYLEDCLVRHAVIAVKLVELFETLFNPDKSVKQRQGRAHALEREIKIALENVSSLDQDRILSNFLNLIQATVRTNFFQRDDEGRRPSFLSFKLLSRQVREMPKPAPYAEIFVYDRRVEGVHLRGGLVARGGLRWSDRREDYRTEILGLMKAQMVKNAVIVPVGAKGGFVPRQLPIDGDRDAVIAEGIAAYKIFITALIQLTDNIVDGKLVPPARTVRRDGDDSYLVVAADKGTASFSDIANEVSLAHDFWLGDAFASGGSNGYDHKKMGITAKGAWVSVQRHFRERGLDVQKDPIRVIGVGDMSGDVFGNGMLLSKTIKLIAAFDHRHIFIDPNPDPGKSFKERERLFNLSRSSWADYDQKLISRGGGVFERQAKSIKLSAQIKKLLGIEDDRLSPPQLINRILRAEADLLWFGGIGTYVKATQQSHADVGDRTNDGLRVNADDLRVKVIGEGANLGMTQAARIAFARRGGCVNTDFIDNSAGVDTSDKEVNLKIALAQAMADGKLSAAKRDQFLASLQDDVAALVLRNNYLQTQTLSMAQALAVEARDRQVRLMRWLERERGLDREVEGLPNDDEWAERVAKNDGLTRPELAVLMAYIKIALFEALKDSPLVALDCFEPELFAAFPEKASKRQAAAVRGHRLRPEIIATQLANALVNRGGLTLAVDLHANGGHGLDEILAVFFLTREVFGLKALWRAIDDLDYKVDASIQTDMHLALAKTLRRQMAWFLARLPRPLKIGAVLKAYREDVAALLRKPQEALSELECAELKRHGAALTDQKVPVALAEQIAALDVMAPACDIVAAAHDLKRPVAEVAAAFFDIGRRVGLDWLRAETDNYQPEGYWDRLAAGAVLDALSAQQRSLTCHVLSGRSRKPAAEIVAAWAQNQAGAIARARGLVDELAASGPPSLAKLDYGARQLGHILDGV